MRKSPLRRALVDKLHRGFVLTCIGVTLYGSSYIGFRYFQYLTTVKPQKLLEQQNLLSEGSSEVLKDSGETLNL